MLTLFAKHRLPTTYLLLTGILLATSVSNIGFSDDTTYPTVKTAPAISRWFQRYTGLTITSRWLATKIGESILRDDIDGKLDINLKSYSATDLMKNRLKHIELTGSDVSMNGAPTIHSIRVASDKRTPVFFDKSDKKLLRPVTFNIKATLNEADLNTYLDDAAKQDKLQVSVPLPPFKSPETIDLKDTTIDITPTGIRSHSVANIVGAPQANRVVVDANMAPVIKHHQLQFASLGVTSPTLSKQSAHYVSRFLKQTLTEMIDLNDPISVKRHHSRISYNTLTLTDDTITIDANLTLSPKQ